MVPFRLKREEAVAAMRDWLGKGFWRPGGLAEQACVVKMTPVYVPYWVFQANTHTYWTADTNQTPPCARGNWYPLSGEHKGSYAGMLIGASGALAPPKPRLSAISILRRPSARKSRSEECDCRRILPSQKICPAFGP